MRAVTRTLVGAGTAVGIAVGSLAAAGTASAATAPETRPAVSAEAVAPLAVNNLGLNTTQAKNWQCWLRDTGYNPGAIDGQLGTNSWKAAQNKFNDLGLNAGAVDGVVGPNTIKALQRYLNIFDYGLTVDGIAGSKTKAAFADFNSIGC
ncbi:peptidoglycan-binding domain-containing protein [Streptomyces cupreus]|uniref:Peptidoglycan-binding protein n=1 Tax=Streptomyces cupreus TaxID=2759956 RepID=A0A7X1JA29_9ACTN|nr:peptidoglycan-binding domain-containing protein [Streptomyces cupreus]MBC2905912.1 peptidoglycan-binding protein [Streptomyces cupreus]